MWDTLQRERIDSVNTTMETLNTKGAKKFLPMQDTLQVMTVETVNKHITSRNKGIKMGEEIKSQSNCHPLISAGSDRSVLWARKPRQLCWALCLLGIPGNPTPYSPILKIVTFPYQNMGLEQYSKGPMKSTDGVASFQVQFIMESPDGLSLPSLSSILLGFNCEKRDDVTRSLEYTLVTLAFWKWNYKTQGHK